MPSESNGGGLTGSGDVSLSIDAMVDLSSELLQVTNVNDYFNVVARWLPRVCPVDHYNLLIANPFANLYMRHVSANFPMKIFTGYSSGKAQSDLMLQEAINREVGEIVHLQEFADREDCPEGWHELVESAREIAGITDSVVMITHISREEGWGSGLSLYRTEPLPVFSTEEIDRLRRLGPLLAAGFKNAWDRALLTTSNQTLSRIFFRYGNLMFFVSENGTPLMLDTHARSSIQLMFGRPDDAQDLPDELHNSLSYLIDMLLFQKNLALVSKEIPTPSGGLRLYLSANQEVTGQKSVFQAVLMCDPEFANLKSLLSSGFTKREVEVLELLQRGISNKRIGELLLISERTVRFHLSNVGEKLNASGKAEIIARAISRSQEIAIQHSLR